MTVTQPPPSMKSPVSVWTSGSQRLIQGEDGRAWHGINGAKFLPECSLTAFGWPNTTVKVDVAHTLTVDATLGTYALTIGGDTLPTVAYDRTAALLLTDIESLAGVTAGDLLVAGGPGSYQLIWLRDDVPTVTTDDTLLTGTTTVVTITDTPKKSQQSTCTPVYFSTIGIYVDNVCQDGGHPAITDFQRRSADALARNWQYVLSEELMDGTWSELAGTAKNNAQLLGGTAPFVSNKRNGSTIRSAATTIATDAAGPLNLQDGIARIIHQWRDFTIDPTDPTASHGMRNASIPVIHIPDWAMGYLPDGPTTLKGREVWTNYGTALVAPGPGYSGNAPGTTAPTQLPAGNFWIYATGIVGYDVAGIPDLDDAASFHERTNSEVNLQEVNALAIFDPTTVLGIEIQEGPVPS